jgi:cytochrome c biogenesis protein CcmG, thiol:disulfide interchange protein DsbE
MWRYLTPIGLFLALIAFFYFGLGRDKETLPSPLIGKPAPQFELTRVDDPAQTLSNRDFAGRMYAINVWGTWCVGCRQEHGALLEIARRNDVPIIGLNWNDDRAKAQRWLQELGNPYAGSAFDGEGRVAIDWGVYGAPETFLVDARGTVVHKQIGPLTLQIWEQDFVPLIREAGGGRE